MADTARMSALRQLSARLPVANQRVATGMQAARDLQLQKTVGTAPTAAPVQQTAAAIGGQQAAQAGQTQLAQVEQQAGQQQQIAFLGGQANQQANQATMFGLQQGARQQEMQNAQRLAGISEEAKQTIFDQRKQFAKDEMGRTFLNERQLADYAKLKSKSDQDYQNYAQTADQVHQKSQMLNEAAYRKLTQSLENDYELQKMGLDQNQILELHQLKKQAEISQQKARAKAANNRTMWSAGLGVAGAATGAVLVPGVGGPVGAMVGAQLGSAVGNYVGSQQSTGV